MKKKCVKPFITLFLVIILSFMVTAVGCETSGFVGRGPAGEDFTFVISCPTCSFINFTLTSPNNSIILDNVEMTQSGNNFDYTVQGSDLSELGTYFGNGGDDNSPLGFCFDITKNGESYSDTQALSLIGYFIFMAFLVAIGFSFNKTNWKMRTFFFMAAALFGIIMINTVTIMFSTSEYLTLMGNTAMIIGIVVFSVYLLYILIYYTIEVVNQLKVKNKKKWSPY